ncbi:hypothetical protein BP6252_10943 [Coleophoma cylindrospora]|uniref:Carboxymuconolactone decarboxylase-like domain-containing protein n=1 Tax=Coleophoma cylindrospora TaxID=1849047 RepID=A0A3D8QNZ1_9HELO|nr:hypothetical protein BP6252_10943 [Coleophoma cylindrospora]
MDPSKVADYIEKVASQPGNDDPLALWPSILICAFTAANNPSAVPLIYLRAVKPHSTNGEARRLILRRLKEALLKGTLLFGIPRVLNSFYALARVIGDEESVDKEIVRSDLKNPLDLTERGMKYFENIYRNDMPAMLEPADRLFPDLRVLAVHIAYGTYISETKVLSPIETSMITIASLLPMDVPTQVKWHMRGLLRNSGSEADIRQALELSLAAVKLSGVNLLGGVPEIAEVLAERLF